MHNETIPGWYGKLPALGDFASRRLPAGLIDQWHDWLEKGIRYSQQQRGEGWLDAYLYCPIWRFLWMPGVYGQSCWLGLVMPSTDRVGRYFPLMLACPLALHQQTNRLHLLNWLTRCETLMLSMLDVHRGVDYLEQQLSQYVIPAVQADETVSQITDVLPGFVCAQGIDHLRQQTFWWTADSSSARCYRGLPTATTFCIF